jgi:mono/diheme cytochrome c family protein
LLTIACLGVVVYAADSQGLLDQLLHGGEVYEQNCIRCHGGYGKGTGQLAAALPVRPADLTDCKLTDEDPVLVGQGIIRHGGRYWGRSSVMPAFGTVLSNSDIADVARYIRSLCADPD